jgi:hypothetical protein
MLLSLSLMSENPDFGPTLLDLFNTPFAVKALNEQRLRVLLDIGSRISFECGAAAVRLFEPHIGRRIFWPTGN